MLIQRLLGRTITVATLRLTATLMIALAVVCPANAQGRGHQSTPSQVPRYTPQSPTVSPYLNLLSRNGSAAGNYFGLVRPQQRQQRINERTTQQESKQQQDLQRLNDQQQVAFEQPKVRPTGTAGWFQNFGQTSPFQQTDHFFGQWPAGGRTGAKRR